MPQVSEDKRFGTYHVCVLSNGKNIIEIFFLCDHSGQIARKNGNTGYRELTGMSYWWSLMTRMSVQRQK